MRITNKQNSPSQTSGLLMHEECGSTARKATSARTIQIGGGKTAGMAGPLHGAGGEGSCVEIRGENSRHVAGGGTESSSEWKNPISAAARGTRSSPGLVL